MNLAALGWDPRRGEPASPDSGHHLVRVARQDRGRCLVLGEGGAAVATLAGRFRHRAGRRADLPVVGDWVDATLAEGADSGRIVGLRPRRSLIRRLSPGRSSDEQPLAANVDVAFLVTGLDGNYRPRRIERLLMVALEGGARPVVVLGKADLVRDPGRFVREAGAVAAGAPVIAVSARTGVGLADVAGELGPGVTGVFLGSSGVGKSTLVNLLLGEERLATSGVRAADSRGRHTTTRRELLCLPGDGGIVIDTPGLREIAAAGAEEDVGAGFPEFEELAGRCRFRDCGHEGEPGCAVRAALAEGRVTPDRHESWREQLRERAQHRRRADRRRGRGRRSH